MSSGILTDVRFVHPLYAFAPIVITVFFIGASINETQFSKALSPILIVFSLISIFVRATQLANAPTGISTHSLLKSTYVRPVQFSKAYWPNDTNALS